VTKPHPITVEVVRNAVVAYADEMANVLAKSAYNMMIYEVRDYCCGLLDVKGRMISQNRGGLPIFLADLGPAVEDGISRYGLDGFQPGDIIVMNHGGVCGQHLNNVVIYAPCFHDGQLVGFAANRAHWVDIGGMRQGFGSSATTEIYGEGLQLRSLKIYEAGKRNETLWQILRDNIRYPEASLGDLRAQVAACQMGAQRYAELLSRYGHETVEDCVAVIWDQAEAAARRVVETIPDGEYEAESFLDNDGRNLNVRLRIKVKVIVKGSTMIVDFSEMNPQVASPLNSGRSGGIAGAGLAGSRRRRRMLSSAGSHPSRRHDAEREAACRVGSVEHRASHGHRYHLESLGACDTRQSARCAQGRHGRLLFFRLPRGRRQAIPTAQYLRRRLGWAPERGRRIRQRFDLPG